MFYRKDGSTLRIGPGSRLAFDLATLSIFTFDADGYAAHVEGKLCETTFGHPKTIRTFALLMAYIYRCALTVLQETDQMFVYKLVRKPRPEERTVVLALDAPFPHGEGLAGLKTAFMLQVAKMPPRKTITAYILTPKPMNKQRSTKQSRSPRRKP